MATSNTITEATKTAFSDHLPGRIGPSYARNPAQETYAQKIAEACGAPDPAHPDGGELTLLEAGTGTGKTLGYLVPLMTNAVLTGEKGVVSTHTIALQNQIMNEDGPLACDLVEDVTGQRPTFARRIGKRNFIDTDRVRDLISATRAASGSDAIVDGLTEILDCGGRDL